MGPALTEVAQTGGSRAVGESTRSSPSAPPAATSPRVRAAAGDRGSRIALFALFILHLLSTIVVVPPWQNPDEPQHVMFAAAVGRHGPAMLPNAFDEEIEGDIVRSMARHHWWQYYSRPTPDPLPRTFAGIENVQMSTIHGPAQYYILSGALLERLPLRDSTSRLYVLRALSALLAVATLGAMFAGTQLWFGRTAAFVVSTMAAVHPQFAIASTTAGPDAVVNLAGAAVWWHAGLAWRGNAAARAIAGAWVAALVGAAFARLGAPLIALAVAVSILVVVRSPGQLLRRAVVAVTALALLASVLIAMTPAGREAVERIGAYAAAPIRTAFNDTEARRVSVRAWSDAFLGSFWLTAGWMRYPAPAPLLAVLAVVTGIAIVGLVLGFAAEPALRPRIAVAVGFAVVQLGAVVVVYYLNGIGGQGRYLFPVLSAILSLMWVGVRHAASSIAESRLAVAVIVVAYACNVAAWGSVLLPVYASGR